MNEQLINMLLTISSGVLVYAFSQLFAEFILRPIQEYKKLKGKTAKLLIYYACFYSNPRKFGQTGNAQKWEEGELAMRELAAEVGAFAEIRPAYILSGYAIPKNRNLVEASRCLIGIANSFFVGDSKFEYMEHVRENVKNAKKYMGILE